MWCHNYYFFFKLMYFLQTLLHKQINVPQVLVPPDMPQTTQQQPGIIQGQGPGMPMMPGGQGGPGPGMMNQRPQMMPQQQGPGRLTDHSLFFFCSFAYPCLTHFLTPLLSTSLG